MTQYSIVTDLDRGVGCLACSVACKVVNGVPTGSFWNKTLRIGPNPREGGSGQWPDVELYFLNVQCQHCENPECVKVCPTGASHKTEDGTVQIDKSKCIGCQFCAMSCPYGVRYLNEEERVVEKCTLCVNAAVWHAGSAMRTKVSKVSSGLAARYWASIYRHSRMIRCIACRMWAISRRSGTSCAI